MLGFVDIWASGEGGTGISKVNGSQPNVLQRVADANAYGPWEVIFVEALINDIGNFSGAQTQAQMNAMLDSLRAANPASLIFVTGPWDTSAPIAPGAAYVTTREAARAACLGRSGVWFLDPTGVAYSKADGTHPDTAGHATLAAWRTAAVKAILGIS